MRRREFLTKGLPSYFAEMIKNYKEILPANPEPSSNKQDYFQSFYSCYPLLAEAPYDQLLEEANKLGIDVKNKSKLEIAREIFQERG